MSRFYMYLFSGLFGIVIYATPVGQVLQSPVFIRVVLGIIGVLFGVAGVLTWRIKRQKAIKSEIKERSTALLDGEEREEQ